MEAIILATPAEACPATGQEFLVWLVLGIRGVIMAAELRAFILLPVTMGAATVGKSQEAITAVLEEMEVITAPLLQTRIFLG
ncbi:hypothetical protein MMC30_001466 [Trapelia coarctata]|nr:hypothetical protein [Trapelia coarctata]